MTRTMTRPMSKLTLIAAATSTLLLAACGSMGGKPVPMMTMMFNPASVPDAVKVPAGHKVALETVGSGEITYECKAKAAMADQFEWAFVGPKAVLKDRSGKTVGSYYGPPATWQANDGSKVSGAQLAVSPAPAGNIPLQLVKANPAMATMDKGAMTGVTYIQRVATMGGVAPAKACGAMSIGQREVVSYQADYIFWTAS